MRLSSRFATVLAVSGLIASTTALGRDDKGGWVDLMNQNAWEGPIEGWFTVGWVGLDPKDPKALTAEPGDGVIYNGATGRGKNLISNESFGDVEFHVEFNVPKGSNSGVKFQAVYEVQIFDSFGSKKAPSGSDCGGVYPRSEDQPRYRHIDEGYPPIVNACKAPGEWQELDITFIAPRFDASGKKIACARITAILNGKTVQNNLEVHSPTGSYWRDKERPTGPILIQADHGPVAYRNLKARALPPKS